MSMGLFSDFTPMQKIIIIAAITMMLVVILLKLEPPL